MRPGKVWQNEVADPNREIPDFSVAPRVAPRENRRSDRHHEVPPNYLRFVRHKKRSGP